MPRTLTAPEIRTVLSEAVTVTLSGHDATGRLICRPMHAAVVGEQLLFHGGARGEKHGLIGQPVVATATEIVARIPSWFTDPVRACPASTLYRSVEVRGVLTPITNPDTKAAALHAYSMAEQPEGRFETIRTSDAGYAAQLDRLVVAGLDLSGAVGRGKLGGEKPRGWRKRIAAGLWQRGAPGDLAAIEVLRHEAPDTPLPAPYGAPEGLDLWMGRTADLLAAVELLMPQYWNRGVSRAAIERAHRESDAWVVARLGDQLVGTARAVGDGAKTVWIYDVAVVPAWQGRGVGRALMTWLSAHPQVRGARRVMLRTLDAHAFYRRLGFVTPPPRESTPMWQRR